MTEDKIEVNMTELERLDFLLKYHKNLSIQYGGIISSGRVNNVPPILREQIATVEAEIEEMLVLDLDDIDDDDDT